MGLIDRLRRLERHQPYTLATYPPLEVIELTDDDPEPPLAPWAGPGPAAPVRRVIIRLHSEPPAHGE